MPLLYISNATKQNANFSFILETPSRDLSLPRPKVQSVPIAYGKQVCINDAISQDLTIDQINFIIGQHKGVTHEYLVAQKDVDLAPRGNNIELIYNIGKPVGAENTAGTIETNDSAMDENAAKMREKTVSVIAANLNQSGATPSALDSETIQEVKKGEVGVNEQIKVVDKK